MASPRSIVLTVFLTIILWQSLDKWSTLQHVASLCDPPQYQSFDPPPQASSSSLATLQAGSPNTTTSSSRRNSALLYPPGRQYLTPNVKPHLGQHRPDADAIFAMATGYEIDDHLITIGSLLDTSYQGDIVLGIQQWKNCSKQLQAFITYHAEHSHLIVYTIPPCQKLTPDVFGHARCFTTYAYVNPFWDNNPASKTTNRLTGNDLAARHQSPRKFRYEHYWMWQRNYNPSSRIWLVDFRDLVFQANPMEHSSLVNTTPTTLHLFEESELRRIIEVERFTGTMIRDFFGPGMVDRIGNQTVLCSGVTMGGKIAMEQYLLKMIWHMDNLLGNHIGKGDQAHLNVLYYLGELSNHEGIDIIQVWKNFRGAVATMGYTYQLEALQKGDILDVYGNVIPVLHQFDRSKTVYAYIKKKRSTIWQPQGEALTGANLTIVHPKGAKKPS